MAEVNETDGVPAEVVSVVGKTGVYGEILQIMCKVLDGQDRGRVLRRNVKGPVRIGDLLILLKTDNEAKPMRGKKGKIVT